MYRLLLSFLLQFCAISLIAQKPAIDTSAYSTWPFATGAAISNNGKYVFYYIHNRPSGSSTLVLQAIGNNWRLEIPGATNAAFTPDGREVIYKAATPGNELLIRELPDGKARSFTAVTNNMHSGANVQAKENAPAKLNPDVVQVDVWSYTDRQLQSRQLKDLADQRNTDPADNNHSAVTDSSDKIKARDANVYIVKHTLTNGSPNYFYTTNFKNFTPLSDLHPEKDWNWFKTESHTWTSLDSTNVNGILYKPENFDSSKRYPLILYCGDRMFDVAQPSDGRLNIPSFVSNGYLVFVPEIRLKVGAPGQSVYNTVISAVNYLSKYSWVDTAKLGLQGFELGAFAANYLVTHTKRFAAICSAAGLSDLISAYGSLDANGDSQAPMIEGEPYRLGATLWENPDLYIQNSPIFDADKVTTPLLMMHNKNDDKVPFAQAIELFTGLRRLQKEAWLLQYDDGGHTLQGPSAVDFSMRMAQFFDHYLKGTPAPVWMTRGVPARMKGIVTGLELDR